MSLPRSLDRRALASVARLAAQLDVTGGVRATFRVRDDVVELQSLTGAAVHTAALIPTPGGISDSFSENDLRHLHDFGLITFQKASGQFTLGRGARLEELRRTFAEEFELRAAGNHVSGQEQGS